MDSGSPLAFWRVGAGGAVRNRDKAAMAPGIVFTFRGRIVGAGKSPV